MSVENIIVYSGAHAELPMSHLASKARLSLLSAVAHGPASGRISISVRTIDLGETLNAIRHWPREIDREAWGCNFVLTDVAAMAAYAPYRCTLFLTEDPFRSAAQLARNLSMPTDDLLIRLHHCLMNAAKIVTLTRDAELSLSPLMAQAATAINFPVVPLRPALGGRRVLMIVHPGGERLAGPAKDALSRESSECEVVMDRARIFDHAWSAVVHIGMATSAEPGARLRDAWAGAVPVLQLDEREVQARNRPQGNSQQLEALVSDGKTGFLCRTVEELAVAFTELMDDPIAVRALARAAQRQIDAEKEWMNIADEILQ